MGLLDKLLKGYQRALTRILKKKRILLYSASETMDVHIMDYYNQVSDEDYIFFSYYGNGHTDKRKRRETKAIKPIYKKVRLLLCPLSLIVTADLTYEPLRYKKEDIPILYVNHGAHIVSTDKESNLYAYGKRALDEKGNARFSLYLEPNKRIYDYMNKQGPFTGRVIYTSSKDGDLIKGEEDKYKEYRQGLGVKEDEKLVAIFGTWRAESLFQYLGKDFLSKLEELTKEGYKFVLSIHPREYEKYDENIEPMGPVIDSYKDKDAFFVRLPKDPYIPYLIACDLVISDYTSMYETAILAKKRLIFSYFPDQVVGDLSIARQLKEEIPIIHREDIGRLSDILSECLKKDLDEHILRARCEIYEEEGYYKRAVKEASRLLLADRREG